jgi:hypothetical protein
MALVVMGLVLVTLTCLALDNKTYSPLDFIMLYYNDIGDAKTIALELS